MPTYSNEWDQGDYRANNANRSRMGFGGTEQGASQEAERSRVLGGMAQERGAYQSNFGQSNQARGVTGQGVDLALSAARGQQPSAAEILAQRNNTAAIRAGQSAAAGIKGGPGARVAAMRNAQRMGAQQMADGAQRSEQLRAEEMASARGQVIQGGTAMRAGDNDAQKIQQQNELFQRGANDAQQRFYEGQRTGIQTQEQNNQLQQQQLASGNWSQGRAATQSDEMFGFTKDLTWAKAGAGAGAGAVGGIAAGSGGTETSDAAAKNLVPMGSLASFGTAGGAMAPGSGAAPATFDKMTPGGGMDVMGSLKAHGDYGKRFQSDPSGGMMRSDMVSKEPRNIMYSPGEIKNAESFVDQQRKAGAYASPDMTPIPAPTHATPAYEAAPWLTKEMDARADQDEIAGAAPYARTSPTDDAMAQYVRSFSVDAAVADANKADNRKEAQKIRASFGHDKKPGGGLALGSLAGVLGGFADSPTPTMRSDMTSKNEVMYSDDKTKLKEAFEEGAKYADAEKAGKSVKAPEYARAAVRGNPTAGPKADPKIEAEHAARRLAAVSAPKPSPAVAAVAQPAPTFMDSTHGLANHPDVQQAAQYAAPFIAGPIGGAAITREIKSDEKAKNVIDLDATSMRDGSSDPRTNSFDKTFRRDTPADQRRVKKRVQDNAGKEADAMIASMNASMGKGPSARSEDLQDDAPDLSKAADRAKGAGAIPDAAMYSAMKSMKPSLYSYKAPFTPPEQKVGEVQAGPMANPMAKDPVAGTAIEREPSTGLLAIDKDKALKLTMGSLAVLAEDLEAMKRKLGGGKKKS